jgi:hypothetical protein
VRSRLFFLAAMLGLFTACAASSSGDDPSGASSDSAFTATDFTEDTVLPYTGGWVDAPHGLDGLGQFDRLKGTIHDDVKCSTMVAIGAAIVGGEQRFTKLLDAIEKKREGKKDDLATLASVRAAVAGKRLTPRLLHELTDTMVRAYNLIGGALDSQIAEMVRASGYEAVPVGSSKPDALVESLAPGEVVPLGIIADGEGHIILIWKDMGGTVRIYDSDDLHGHVMPRGSAAWLKRVNDPQSSWDRREKYR